MNPLPICATQPQLDDTAHLHAPYIELNESLVSVIAEGDIAAALAQLQAYLLKSERAVLAALQYRRHRPRV
ncbi:hypothetical protein [Phaeobacter sp. SYSU ZJ3003]|uniref:hypothetical protein n=1 Tax=Phaeobacter sp. SYSU ZJ3003 TaxID=2109330 RepID=UPI00351C613E